MTSVLRISLFIGIVIYVFFIVWMLKKRSLDIKYSLLWLLSAFVLLIVDIFPQIVGFLSSLFGIATASNFIYLAVMFFMLLLLISLTSIVSRQKKEIRTLIQNLSILKAKVEDMENRN